MTVRIRIELICDEHGCYAVYRGAETSTTTRWAAGDKGWTFDLRGRDYCPEHPPAARATPSS